MLKFHRSLFNLKLPCVTGCYRVGQLSFWGHLDPLRWVAPLLALRKRCVLPSPFAASLWGGFRGSESSAAHVGLNEECCRAVGQSCEVAGLSSCPKDVWVVSHPVFLQTALQGSAGGKEACCLALSPAFLLLCTESHQREELLQDFRSRGWKDRSPQSVRGAPFPEQQFWNVAGRAVAGGGPRVGSAGDLGTTWSPLCSEHVRIPRDGSGLAP